MSKIRLSFFFLVAFALFASTALFCASAVGQNNFKVIHSFSGYPDDGHGPTSTVVFDRVGNMYGATPGGGSQTGCGDLGCGIIYELSPDGQGNWTETILYNFCQNFNGISCLDGAYPNGLTIDTVGNLYGTTFSGGTGQGFGFGTGIAFELSPPKTQGGTWTETVLHNFCSDVQNDSCLDGWVGVVSPMVIGPDGNLYGTAALGGTGHVKNGEGLAFELTRQAGMWTETILHNFCTQGSGDECPDGYEPNGVAFDKAGSLYGTTGYSGNVNSPAGGTLFELPPSETGRNYKLLVNIPPNFRPFGPAGAISFDAAGNLYGTLSAIYGGVFRLEATKGKIALYKFNQDDGFEPLGGVYIDSSTQSLYGTNSGGGGGPGNIFKIGADRKETILHKFCSEPNCADGELPWVMPSPDASGNLYGTTEFGGAYNQGVIFEVAP